MIVQENINGGTHEKLARKTIVANNVISNNANVHYGANELVTLSPGFSIELGSTILIDSNGCNE